MGVCNPPVGISEGDAKGFDDGVKIGGRVVVPIRKRIDHFGFLELLKDPQRHEGDDALAIRRVLPELKVSRSCTMSSELDGHGICIMGSHIHVMFKIFKV